MIKISELNRAFIGNVDPKICLHIITRNGVKYPMYSDFVFEFEYYIFEIL